MPAQRKAKLTPQEYLAIEREAATKSEYFDGEIIAMAGARHPHNYIKDRLIGLLFKQLDGGPCHTLSSDMRVRSPDAMSYTYPDIVIQCDKPVFDKDKMDVLLNPTGIIEVLSPSTAGYDWNNKFRKYRQIESLKEYILISTTKILVERYQHMTDGTWVFTEYTQGSILCLSIGNVEMQVNDIYSGIDFFDEE